MTRHWRRSLSDNGASGTPTDHHKKNRTYSETCTCKRSVSFMKESCRTLLVCDPQQLRQIARVRNKLKRLEVRILLRLTEPRSEKAMDHSPAVQARFHPGGQGHLPVRSGQAGAHSGVSGD